jgi:hypothetical protein
VEHSGKETLETYFKEFAMPVFLEKIKEKH